MWCVVPGQRGFDAPSAPARRGAGAIPGVQVWSGLSRTDASVAAHGARSLGGGHVRVLCLLLRACLSGSRDACWRLRDRVAERRRFRRAWEGFRGVGDRVARASHRRQVRWASRVCSQGGAPGRGPGGVVSGIARTTRRRCSATWCDGLKIAVPEDRGGSAQLMVFLPQRLDSARVVGPRPGRLVGVDVGLFHPQPH